MDYTEKFLWSVWIDDSSKIIFAKEKPNARQVCFKTFEAGLQAVHTLITKGYKIG